MTTPVSPITTSFSHFVENLVIPRGTTCSPLSGMSTFGHNDPPIQCDVSNEAANLRRQVHFLKDFTSGNSFTTATAMCGRCPPQTYGGSTSSTTFVWWKHTVTLFDMLLTRLTCRRSAESLPAQWRGNRRHHWVGRPGTTVVNTFSFSRHACQPRRLTQPPQ